MDTLAQRDRNFRYFADPLCVAALLIYAANRWLFKPWGVGGNFGLSYLNDVLCLPLLLPMILYVQRRLGLRGSDAPPRPWEILQHWVIFSVVFELILPRYPGWFRTTADPLDVVAYLAGGIGGWLWWSGRVGIVRPRGRFYYPGKEPVAVGC
jgi:hypothetical protein